MAAHENDAPPPPPARWLGTVPAGARAQPDTPAEATQTPSGSADADAASAAASSASAALSMPLPTPRYSWWARLPLRTRLVAILLIALIVSLTITGLVVQAVLRGFLVKQLDRQLELQYARSVDDVRYLERVLGSGRRSAGDEIPTNYAFFLYVDGEASGQARAGSSGETLPQFVLIDSEQAADRDGAPFTLRAAKGGDPWRAVAIPVEFAGGTGTVTIALPLEGASTAVKRLNLATIVIGAIVTVACLAMGSLAIRRSFAPLTEVENTAAAIAAGDLSRRVPARPETTEVGRLTASLNGMLTQIESAFRAQEASEARTRRFAADASHELRTPLAAIRGFAELFRLGAVREPEDVARTMNRIEAEATRMGVLVEDLLLLARLDEQRPGRSDPVDLAVLAGDAVHDARGLAPDRAVTLTGLTPGTGPQPAVVTGDDARLRQVVANLVGNAVRHTPKGTPVEVAVGTTGHEGLTYAVLEVRDHGPGIPDAATGRVFERFYRLDASRQRGKGGGSGLGLSIVAAVVAAHGGEVDLTRTPGGGATFRVSMPVRQQALTSTASGTSQSREAMDL